MTSERAFRSCLMAIAARFVLGSSAFPTGPSPVPEVMSRGSVHQNHETSCANAVVDERGALRIGAVHETRIVALVPAAGGRPCRAGSIRRAGSSSSAGHAMGVMIEGGPVDIEELAALTRTFPRSGSSTGSGTGGVGRRIAPPHGV
jgi:hypothetical protein